MSIKYIVFVLESDVEFASTCTWQRVRLAVTDALLRLRLGVSTCGLMLKRRLGSEWQPMQLLATLPFPVSDALETPSKVS